MHRTRLVVLVGVIDPVLGAANIDHFLYWDNIHPTARVQAMWAEGFAATVPQPASLVLVGLGLMTLFLIARAFVPLRPPQKEARPSHSVGRGPNVRPAS